MKKFAFTVLSVICFVSSVCAKVPVIGLSGHNSGDELVAGLNYVASVRLAGGLPVVLPVSMDDAEIDEMLSLVDGLILTGGEDFDPLRWYGEEPRRELKGVNPIRDVFDVKLARAAVAKGIPVLGICRGLQTLGVAFGGALFQDIPSDVNGNVKHNQPPTKTMFPTHSISIEKGSQLAAMLGVEKTTVNSFHHQAVKRMPQGLKAVAFAADGVVEALEREGKIAGYEDAGGWILGVQFHPECMVPNGVEMFLPIFKTLVDEAKKFESLNK